MHNFEIRESIRRAGFFHYEVAAALGVSESYFSKKMTRSELPKEEQQHILKTVEKMEMQRGELD